jgi:hypothetical protein
MPAQRVEHFDWSTSLCSVVTLPDDPHTACADEASRQRFADMITWLHAADSEAQGVYQKTVYLTGPGPDGLAGLRCVYRFSDRATAQAFTTRFC